MDAPVAGALATCGVLEVDPPVFTLWFVPLSPENLDLRIEVSDQVERSISGVTFVHDDFVGEGKMMPQHFDERIVVLDAVPHRSVERDFHSVSASETPAALTCPRVRTDRSPSERALGAC